MDDQLKAAFTDEQRADAQNLGQRTELSLQEKTAELFEVLGDPLLSATDVADLLGGGATATQSGDALDALVEAGTLESTDSTSRPLDPEGIVLFRRAGVEFGELVIYGLQNQLSDGTTNFQLTMDGRLVRSIARVDRLDVVSGEGAQREEIRSHVKNIARGITSGIQVPNPILLVLIDANVWIDDDEHEEGEEPTESDIVVKQLDEFRDVYAPNGSGEAVVQTYRLVELTLPYRPAAFDTEKAALLVDGQQRTAALSLVSVEDQPTVSLSINALVADDDAAKRIFSVANDTRRINADLSRALVGTMGDVPAYLAKDRVRAAATAQLGLRDSDSPFHGLVMFPRERGPSKVLAYNSVFQVASAFESSIFYDGEDEDALAEIIKKSFAIVKKIWPDAWGMRPAESKLMHGAGLRAMGGLIVDELEFHVRSGKAITDDEVWEELERNLQLLKPVVAWTEDEAASGNSTARSNWEREISKRQNTSQDISELRSFLKKALNRAQSAARS